MGIFRAIFYLLGLMVATFVVSQSRTFYNERGYMTAYESEAFSYEIDESTSGAFVRYFVNADTVAMRGVKVDGRLHGKVVTYYENGNKKEVSRYQEGYKQGDLSRWYHSGQKMGDFYLMHYEEINSKEYDHQEKIITLFDSTGVVLVSEGNGEAFELGFDGNVCGVGEVKKGLKEGSWSGELLGLETEAPMTYIESYSDGRLLQGVSEDLSGNRFQYDEIATQPEYKGGLENFYKFLGKNMKYPRLAQRKGIEGRVFVQFTIEKDGSLTDIEVVKGIGGGCDEEAFRVISISKNWIPGKSRGQIARSRLIQNILFKFQ